MKQETINLSPSILEYEPNLTKNLYNISLIINSNPSEFHIDHISPDFVPKKEHFQDSNLKWIYQIFHDKIPLDFHLMIQTLQM
jgi:pentose-5-phosphate-3-epimerase